MFQAQDLQQRLAQHPFLHGEIGLLEALGNLGRFGQEEIVEGIGKTTDLVGEIAAASQEQSQGIDQVNTAVNQMDKVTQQTAASK